jgi:hypothetical protein
MEERTEFEIQKRGEERFQGVVQREEDILKETAYHDFMQCVRKVAVHL